MSQGYSGGYGPNSGLGQQPPYGQQQPPYGQQGGYGQYPPGPYGAHGPKHHHGPKGFGKQGYNSGSGYPPQGAGYPPQGAGYPPQGYGQGYAQQGGYGQQQRLPDSAHEHGLIQEPSNDKCKVCQKPLAGTPAFVCHQCPLVLCYDCGNAIFYGNKAKQVHPHPLALRVRNAWKCDLCKQHFRGTASFYCKPCDFDACSRCYVGF